MGVQIAASILSADFCRLHDHVVAAESGGADSIHCDVMDGHFVPNITIGPLVVRAVRRSTRLPLDVHLMIERPEHYISDFAQAGPAPIAPEVTTRISWPDFCRLAISHTRLLIMRMSGRPVF